MIKIILFITVILLGGCVSLPSADGVSKLIDKSGKAIATVQAVNTAKIIAETGKTKAIDIKKSAKRVDDIISSLSNEKDKVALTSQVMDTRTSLAENTYMNGFKTASIFWLSLIVLGMIIRYFFPKAKKETKEF